MSLSPASSMESVNILGVAVDSLALADLIKRVDDFVGSGVRHTVMYANVHVLNTAYLDPQLRRILNEADLVYCDGAGVRLGGRLLGGYLPERMTGADWIYSLCDHCRETGRSLFFLGGAPEVAASAAQRLCTQYPGLRIRGTHHGFVHDEEEQSAEAVAQINSTRPDIVLVGMGTPLQEEWISSHRSDLDVPVCWAVGALFDYVAGEVPRGPRWMLDHGLEWLYRLWLEPRRLGNRYLIGNPLFCLRVLHQRMFSDRKGSP
jgi:N-acetylglucosaminyldiphosphoundecaprenol N-acetyl-beta-D-mannosaminyltransferase